MVVTAEVSSAVGHVRRAESQAGREREQQGPALADVSNFIAAKNAKKLVTAV
jgi:hypothetical protein